MTPPNAKSASTKKTSVCCLPSPKKTRGGGFKYFFDVHPYFGNMIQLDELIFFNLGWFNHQLPENISPATTSGSRMARSRRNGPSVGKSNGRSQRLGKLGKTTRVHSTERLSGEKHPLGPGSINGRSPSS